MAAPKGWRRRLVQTPLRGTRWQSTVAKAQQPKGTGLSFAGANSPTFGIENMQINLSQITKSLGPPRSFPPMRLARFWAWVEQHALFRSLWAKKAHILELALVIGAYAVYILSRGLIFSDFSGTGLENAGRIISAEKSLGIFWEPGWQSWVLTHVKGLAAFLNWTYIFTYWPIIVVAGTALYVVNRPKYYYYRSVVVINLAAALIIFMVFPVTSPFNVTEYFVNTIQVLGPTIYGGPEMASFYNAHAAMPSLHFSWTVILGVLFVRTFKGWFRIIGVFYPVITFLAITITGNHFIMDAIAGGILAIAAFAVMELFFRGGIFRMRRKNDCAMGIAAPHPLPRGVAAPRGKFAGRNPASTHYLQRGLVPVLGEASSSF